MAWAVTWGYYAHIFFCPGCPSTGCLGGTNLSLIVLKLSSFFGPKTMIDLGLLSDPWLIYDHSWITWNFIEALLPEVNKSFSVNSATIRSFGSPCFTIFPQHVPGMLYWIKVGTKWGPIYLSIYSICLWRCMHDGSESCYLGIRTHCSTISGQNVLQHVSKCLWNTFHWLGLSYQW